MPKLPVVSGRQARRAFEKAGWVSDRQPPVVTRDRDSARGDTSLAAGYTSPTTGDKSPTVRTMSPPIRSLSIVPGAAFPIAPQHAMNQFPPRSLFNARISAPPAHNSSPHRLHPEIRRYNGDPLRECHEESHSAEV